MSIILFLAWSTCTRSVVHFRPFVKNQLTSMKTVYEKWGLPFEGTAYQKRLAAEEVRRCCHCHSPWPFAMIIRHHYSP